METLDGKAYSYKVKWLQQGNQPSKEKGKIRKKQFTTNENKKK